MNLNRLAQCLKGFPKLDLLSGFRRDNRGVTAIEYAMIAGIIIIAIVGSVSKIAPQLDISFNNVSSEL